MIGDSDLAVAKLYNMLPAEEPGTSEGRTAANNATVRSVFVIGPDKRIKLMLTYPMTTGRNFDEILRVVDSMQLTQKHQRRHAGELEGRRRRDHRGLGVRRRGQEAVPRLQDHQALPAHDQAAVIFEQVATGGCQSYLVGCPDTYAAALIDPEASQIDRYVGLAARHGLHVRYVIDTHTHADHFSATRQLAERFGARDGDAPREPGTRRRHSGRRWRPAAHRRRCG